MNNPGDTIVKKIVNKMKDKKPYPLRWSMTGMLLLGWLLPLVLIAVTLLWFVSSMIDGQISKTIRLSMDKAVENCESQLEQFVQASKNASYDSTIKEAYAQYKKDGMRYLFNNKVKDFMIKQYWNDPNFLCTVIFLLEEPQNCYYTYRENNGYSLFTNFVNNAQEEIMAFSDQIDTRAVLLMLDGHLYLVRNLMEGMIKPYGMIVIELSPDFLFGGLDSVWGATEYEILLDGQPLLGTGCGEGITQEDIRKINAASRYHSDYTRDARGTYAYRTIMDGAHNKVYLVKLDSKALLDDVSMLRIVLVVIAIFIVPLVFMIFRFFYVKVTRPVAGLVEASREIADAHYGHMVNINGSSQEFDYLGDTFNAMSKELKHQFEQIYLEELALKDANIMALQSQINPHFLNNTLEIINWEARMNGNEKVSGMIEALATMLNATMNRKQKRFIPLSEELEYVDSYLFIIKQRFGERFQVERQIDENLLETEVPMLIIQPIVENAVEHGVGIHKAGKVSMHIYAIGDKMYIEVYNDGALSREDKERIDYLLGQDGQDENEHHVSLGIRNVDRRLHIIYGDGCGLTIKSDNGTRTVSTLIVKIDKESNNSQ